MLSDEVRRYEALTGESSVGVPISRLGGYLDGYEKGREDAIEEFKTEMRKFYFNAELQSAKDDPCVIDAMIDLAIRTAEQIKEHKND